MLKHRTKSPKAQPKRSTQRTQPRKKFTTTVQNTTSVPTDDPTAPINIKKKTKKSKTPYKRFVTNPQRQVLSGIQPTGVVHIGNLFGAVSNWVSLQYTEPLLQQQVFFDNLLQQRNNIQTGEITQLPQFHPLQHKPVLFTVVDLHAITVPRPAGELESSVRQLTATLLGCGIRPDRAKLFIQSHVTQHTELAWLLTCNTPVSWLYRMTQFKDKSQKLEKQAQSNDTQGNNNNNNDNNTQQSNEEIPLSQLPRGVMAGLLQYPALMAADILLYNATHVPVGDDQTQHLEFARELARTMNSTFSPIFVEPNHIHNPFATRVMSLRTPENKMSKSDPSEQGKITLDDSNVEIEKKVRSAVTDAYGGVTYDTITRPGLSNLLNIYAASENMQILTQHHQKIDSQLKDTFFFKNNMLSLDTTNPLTTAENSRRLYDFAMSSVTQTPNNNNNLNSINDPFINAYNEYATIMAQTPSLVTPQQLAQKHSTDLLSAFKPAVAASLVSLIEPIREQTKFILNNNPDYMHSVVKEGGDSAREIAIQTVARTKDVMGMRF